MPLPLLFSTKKGWGGSLAVKAVVVAAAMGSDHWASFSKL